MGCRYMLCMYRGDSCMLRYWFIIGFAPHKSQRAKSSEAHQAFLPTYLCTYMHTVAVDECSLPPH